MTYDSEDESFIKQSIGQYPRTREGRVTPLREKIKSAQKLSQRMKPEAKITLVKAPWDKEGKAK